MPKTTTELCTEILDNLVQGKPGPVFRARSGDQCKVQLVAGSWLGGGLALLREGGGCDRGDGKEP